MSKESTPVTSGQLTYLSEHTRGDDAFTTELKAAAAASGIPAIQVTPAQASLMQILLRLRDARDVVEVGTLAGYSAIWMARALPPDGRVRTVEFEPRHADFAEEWIARSDVADKIEVHRGDAREVLAGFATDSADAFFIDADKESYSVYLDQAVRILRPRGLVMVDNAFAFGQLLEDDTSASVEAIRQFNEKMAARSDLRSIIVPLGDGCWVGVAP